jgi:hypothetical protein
MGITYRLALALMAALAVQPAGAAKLTFGVAALGEDGFCLSFLGAERPIGSPVTLVSTRPPQAVARGTIESATAVCQGISSRGIPGPYYFVRVQDSIDLVGALWITVPGRPPARLVADRIRLSLGSRYPNAQVRSCASSEGLHLTVWSGTPLRSERLWHRYWYLGYDVEPDCQPADYRDGSNR